MSTRAKHRASRYKKKILKISSTGLALIKSFEGCRLTPYQDAGGVWTIGWGNTYLLNGQPVTGSTKKITQAEADSLFEKSVAEFYEPIVRKQVTRKLTQNQYDACVSFCYNLGGLKELASKINAGTVTEADWCMYVYAKGRKLQGLVNRRKKEWQLYSSI